MFDFKKYVLVGFKKYNSKMVLLRCDNISFEKKIGEILMWVEFHPNFFDLSRYS